MENYNDWQESQIPIRGCLRKCTDINERKDWDCYLVMLGSEPMYIRMKRIPYMENLIWNIEVITGFRCKALSITELNPNDYIPNNKYIYCYEEPEKEKEKKEKVVSGMDILKQKIKELEEKVNESKHREPTGAEKAAAYIERSRVMRDGY